MVVALIGKTMNGPAAFRITRGDVSERGLGYDRLTGFFRSCIVCAVDSRGHEWLRRRKKEVRRCEA
jgi:hypothetical protein